MQSQKISISKITIKFENGQKIELSEDTFVIQTTTENTSIIIPNDFLELPDPSFQNKLKEEYEDIFDDVFVDIEDNSNYQVSKNGKVRNKKTKKELKQQPNSKGYQTVVLTNKGKQTLNFVHRIVCQTFLHNPLNLPHVNHKDHNPSNNTLSNLEWSSIKDNMFDRMYGNEEDELPNGCEKIESIKGVKFDNLYYKDTCFYIDFRPQFTFVRKYEGSKTSKQKQWALQNKNGEKVSFTQSQFLKEHLEFIPDFVCK